MSSLVELTAGCAGPEWLGHKNVAVLIYDLADLPGPATLPGQQAGIPAVYNGFIEDPFYQDMILKKLALPVSETTIVGSRSTP